MDYKEEYQKALERAKQGLPIDEVFPELRESEDEGMIRILKEGLEGLTVFNYTPVDKILSWLEKKKEQKPAEWSEKDKEMLEKCISHMINIIPVPGKHGLEDMSFEKHTDEELVTWLNLLPQRFSLQPKQEWSEEDEEMIERICANLEYLIAEAGCDSQVTEKLEKRIKWMRRLKSLRPQPHWKPSQEQMITLKEILEMRNYYLPYRKALSSLYNDLKKL